MKLQKIVPQGDDQDHTTHGWADCGDKNTPRENGRKFTTTNQSDDTVFFSSLLLGSSAATLEKGYFRALQLVNILLHSSAKVMQRVLWVVGGQKAHSSTSFKSPVIIPFH